MDQLEGEILQYEAQLVQVRSAASELPEGPEKNNLLALEADLKELITLSKNSLAEFLNKSASKDLLTVGCNLPKTEITELNSKEDENVKCIQVQATESDLVKTINLKNDLEGLKGIKCQAPFVYKWTTDVTYHNAFISDVQEPDQVNGNNDVKVKVMFTNPTHKEMLPCPYYLEGDCKFDDDKCRYSHGELVLLSSLKKYSEPVFSKLCAGCKVFAKQNDGLWYRGSVVSLNEFFCEIKFELNCKKDQVPFHNILPLDSNKSDNENSDSDEDDDENDDGNSNLNIIASTDNNEEIVKRILRSPPVSALGEWEKFTKGFGSKMMAKMGYIFGSGLGKNGAGRVEPVPAVIFPAGKSLDHCMMLKEKVGNDFDLFKAERKIKYLTKKHEEKLKKAYEKEKNRIDVFTFLNTKLDTPKVQNTSDTEAKNQFKNETTRNLNVTGLQLAEEARRIEKEVKSLNQSLAKHIPHSYAFNILKEKLALKENRLSQLQASEKKIKIEQDQRRDRQKLTIF